MPDSSSSAPTSRLLTEMLRSTLNTAAASVEASTAPHSSAIRQSKSKIRCSAAPVTAMLTATATVDSTTPGQNDARTSGQRVVSPPSVRIRTSAASPSDSVSDAFSNWMPMPASPSSTPIARYSTSDGKPEPHGHPHREHRDSRTAATTPSTTDSSWATPSSCSDRFGNSDERT